MADVVRAGRQAATDAGLTVVMEYSPGSESSYFHVLRDGLWRGVRVSCHAAVYDCSIDYQQVRVTEPFDAASVAAAKELVVAAVTGGGNVVADPQEVNTAIAKIAAVMADGRVYTDADGSRWRWSADDDEWQLRGRHWGEGEPEPPQHRPNPAVSARIRCQVRHSQNVNAKWAAESAERSEE